jgi:spore germination protein YaaH
MLGHFRRVLVVIVLLTTGCAQSARSESVITPTAGPGSVSDSASVSGRSATSSAVPTVAAGAPAKATDVSSGFAATPLARAAAPLATPSSLPNANAIPTAVRPASATSRETFAYYVPYDPTSWWSLQAQIDQISIVAPQWVSVDACGNLGSRDDLTLLAYAHANGVKVVPTLPTGSGWLNHQILTDPATAQRVIEQSASYVVSQGYDGLDADFEGVRADDRDAFTSFAERLGQALHQNGKLFTMALPAKTSDSRTGWSGATNYGALAPSIDRAIIMTYEYSGATTPPGSTAPQQWVDQVLAYTSSVIPPQKVLLGVALYGRDWNLTQGGRSRAVTYPQAAAIARAEGEVIATDPTTRSGTFRYTIPAGQPSPLLAPVPKSSHDIVVHQPPACPIQPPATPTQHFTPTPSAPGGVADHEVWIENAASVQARLGLAARYGIAGVAFWRLGQEDPAAWPVIGSWRAGRE